MVTGVIPSPPRFLPSIFIAHRVQQSHCSSIVHRMLLTHALALSASQFVHKEKSQRIYTSMHSAGLELTKLTYTRLEDNLIRHRGDRPGTLYYYCYSYCYCHCHYCHYYRHYNSAGHLTFANRWRYLGLSSRHVMPSLVGSIRKRERVTGSGGGGRYVPATLSLISTMLA